MDRDTRDLVIRELAALGWTQKRIAAEIGCSPSMAGVVLRNERPRQQRDCAMCGRPIPSSRRADAKTCSSKCMHRRNNTRPARPEQVEAWRAEHDQELRTYDALKQAGRRVKTLDHATRHRREWTGPDLEMAARDDMTMMEIALRLGRTYRAVVKMREKLRDGRKTRLAETAEPAQQEVA